MKRVTELMLISKGTLNRTQLNVPSSLWPRNSRDLNTTVDYKFWSLMQKRVHKHRISNVDELRERTWDSIDQNVIDIAVNQWRTRLRACV